MIQEEEISNNSKKSSNINNIRAIDSTAKSIRSLSQGPNRSRAELLARRQQLAAANGRPTQLGWQANNGQHNDHSISSNDQSDSLEADEQHQQQQAENGYSMVSNRQNAQLRRSSRSQRRGANNRGLSAEAKLESLSEQLKLHQAATANWPNDLTDLTSNSTPTAIQTNGLGSPTTNIENVYILLAKKDKDLQLAAELGKVLLEKNDELSRANEEQAEEYSRRLESLEEEKHKMRLRLEQLEADYENRLIDVQTDCRLLEGKLAEQREQSARREREKSRLIDELGQQSQRLSAELAEATCSEELLNAQIEQLRERLGARGSDRQDQNVQVEALKSEIDIISQRKQDLERRLRLATDERVQLSSALEETGERLLMLESLLSERDSRLRDIDSELHELRDATGWLSGQLDAMIGLNEKLAAAGNANSNYNDFSAAAGDLELDAMGDRRSQLIDQLRELRLRTRTRTKATEIKLINNRQQQQHQSETKLLRNKSKNRRLSRLARPGSKASDEQSTSESDEDAENQRWLGNNSSQTNFDGPQECLAIYKLLTDFQAQLEKRRSELRSQQQQLLITNKNSNAATQDIETSSASQANAHTSNFQSANSISNQNNNNNNADDSGISAAYDDTSSSSAAEDATKELQQQQQEAADRSLAQNPKRWQAMLTEIKLLIEDLPCKSCHTKISEGQKHEQLSRDFARISEELRRCEEQKLKLRSQQTELESKVGSLEELCATLKSDLESNGHSPDEIVRSAWKRRDEAVARKNACEIALAKSRIENMQLSSQLMEVVQQKSQLAHQVAQFEDDMHYMTQYSVKAKFSWEEQAERFRRDQKESRQKQLQQQQASVAGISLGPLTSLLGNFGAPSSSDSRPNSAPNNSNNGSPPGTNTIANPDSQATEQAKGSIMRNFANSRLNLTRFWSNNKTSTLETTTPSSPTTG